MQFVWIGLVTDQSERFTMARYLIPTIRYECNDPNRRANYKVNVINAIKMKWFKPKKSGSISRKQTKTPKKKNQFLKILFLTIGRYCIRQLANSIFISAYFSAVWVTSAKLMLIRWTIFEDACQMYVRYGELSFGFILASDLSRFFRHFFYYCFVFVVVVVHSPLFLARVHFRWWYPM